MIWGPAVQEKRADDWWGDIESEVLGCLAAGTPVRPGDVAKKLGMSESAVTSLLSMLVHDGKVRICLVERHPDTEQGWERSA